MANSALEDEDEKPLDPAVDRVRRKLVRFMLINLGILFLALMAVVGAIVYKYRNADPAPAETQALSVPSEGMIEGEIALPTGSRLISQSLSGGRMSLHVEEANGAQALYIFDIASRRMVGRFQIGTN